MNILLVEDEPEHMLLFKDFLERKGHTVHAAATKDRALELLRGNKYDVAAVDLVLVASTGDTVAVAAHNRGLGVVLMTAGHELSTVQDLITSLELRGCKVSGNLKKPFAPMVLLLALEEAYRNKEKSPEPTDATG